ncbi:MAG: ComEC/Rec2 family competence protein [Chitinophagales bacterium]
MNTKLNILKNVPLVRVTSIVILGVTTGIYFQHNTLILFLLCIAICLLIFAQIIRLKYKLTSLSSQIKWVSSLLFLSLFFVAFTLSALFNSSKNKSHFTKYIKEDSLFKIQIIDNPIAKENSQKITGKVIEVLQNDKTYHTTGKLLVYIQKDSISEKLKYGDVLLGKTFINGIDPPKNPFEFNYKDYLKFHNIFQTAYLSSENWQLIKQNNGNFIIGKLFKLRNYLYNVIDKYIAGNNEKAIANAILIGKKDLLDYELIRAYSTSGAMHVLAVSGLHVGIVYLIFNNLLFFLNNNKTKVLKSIILVLLIWLYAILTGASPSVLRAATMFSFIAIGTSFKQYVNIYNTIAASALLLILVNPYIITEVGFQLSYLAVIGIIFLQPKIYNLLYTENYILDKTWAITAVSISAQIATFPLGILYFHQFPNFFFVSNLIVIPVAFAIVFLGVSLFVFSFIHPLAGIIGFILSKVIFILNYSVSFIDKLPYSLSSGLHISLLECYLIYLFIIAFSIALAYKNKNALKVALVSTLFFTVSLSYHKLSNGSLSYLTVYYVPKQSAVELNNGNTRYSYFDKDFKENDSQLLFRVKHNWWGTYTTKQTFKQSNTPIDIITFKNKEILFVDSNFTLPKQTVETDYCILKHQQKLYLSSFTKKIKAKKYIFDSSNKSYYNKYWKKDCDSLNLDCYFVTEQSAFVEKL